MKAQTIGLTGGPAVGKTTVAEMLRKFGAAVVSADKIGHELLERNRRVKQSVKKLLGGEVFGIDGAPNRGIIAGIVFADCDLLAKFNAIVHPPLLRELRRRVNRLKWDKSQEMIVVEAALIFEWGIADWFDYIISVDAPLKLRLARCAESGIRPGQLRRRIKVQMPQRDKNALADWVVKNDGGIDKLKSSVGDIVKLIRRSNIELC